MVWGEECIESTQCMQHTFMIPASLMLARRRQIKGWPSICNERRTVSEEKRVVLVQKLGTAHITVECDGMCEKAVLAPTLWLCFEIPSSSSRSDGVDAHESTQLVHPVPWGGCTSIGATRLSPACCCSGQKFQIKSRVYLGFPPIARNKNPSASDCTLPFDQ